MMNKLGIISVLLLLTCTACMQERGQSDLYASFQNPSEEYRPETWFHFMGNNISKEGITLDLEAIKGAGLQGIHLFNKSGRPYPDVEQIEILSPEWEDMIRHAADECERLGLKFTMQNCPGWSMTGGPWVPVEEAQRELVETVYHFQGGRVINTPLQMDENYALPEYNYQDVTLLAFPTVTGDDQERVQPIEITSNNTDVPWNKMINPIKPVKKVNRKLPDGWKPYSHTGITPVNGEQPWVNVKFGDPTTLRSLIFPPIRFMLPSAEYPVTKVVIIVQAKVNNELVDIAEIKIPNGNWTDRQYDVTLAVPETTSDEYKLTFTGEHVIAPSYILLESKPRLHNHEPKAARALRSLQKEVQLDIDPQLTVSSSSIQDISDFMDESGNLNWQAPEGNWTVVRIGHVNMRRTNKPAVPEATGWEASKLDKIAIENHLKNGMIGNLIKNGGPIGDGKLDGLLIDSWESFIPTWSMNSEDMYREFESRRGYKLKPFLPATMGYIVDDVKTTGKFLRDLRHTMDELYIYNFFSHFATVAHEMGTEVYTEGAGGEVLPIDPMRYYGVADVPMTEFWHPGPPSMQDEYAKPIFNAASATHLYNKPRLAAEACTQVGVKWNEHPFTVKDLIDYNFTKGVNHLVFHTFSHTPQVEVYPGSSFGGNIGFPFVRNQTWWKHMPDWIDYLARSQFMLQQGEYVADVLWYYGDHFERPPFDLDEFPEGYRFDYLNSEILHEKLSIENGKIKVVEGGTYQIITLRDSEELTLSTVRRLKELVLAGAVIHGAKPVDSPSLMDNENDLKELIEISNELWGNEETGVKQVGKGSVYWGQTLQEVLNAESIQQDVITPTEEKIYWIHRETEKEDIYFVSARNSEAISASLSFRIQDSAPEIWNPFNGQREDAIVWSEESDRINVAYQFDPKGSVIIVFPKGKEGKSTNKVAWNGQTVLDSKTGWYQSNELMPKVKRIGGQWIFSESGNYQLNQGGTSETVNQNVNRLDMLADWQVSFSEGWDTPVQIRLGSLQSLTELENDNIRHYSGTTTYENQFEIEDINAYHEIDLGAVANIAELWCNGRKVDTRWSPPYVFDVSEFVKSGKNDLTVHVTNTWRNQLIYDNTRPKAEKKTWTTAGPKADEKELEKSGLIGPVAIRSID
ncbi:MAG: hypothetical protein JXR10_07120 [Cyclobacteriaceae bacterium]